MCVLAGGEFLGFSCDDAVTVVLEDDGTIVADEAYFLCLPINTKFMLLHERESWSPLRRSKRDFLGLLVDFQPSSDAQFPGPRLLNCVFCASQWMEVQPGWPGSLW